MNQFILSAPNKGVTATPPLALPPQQLNNKVTSKPVFLPAERRATLDKFYFSAENFNVVMKLFQDLFLKEFHVILTKNDIIKSLVVRSLASAKRKQPSLTTIVDMNKAAVVEGLPSIQRQVQLHPELHVHVASEQPDLLDTTPSNELSQSYLEELTGDTVVSSDIENLESLVSQSAVLHTKPPMQQMSVDISPPPPPFPLSPSTSMALPFSAPTAETYSSLIASLAQSPVILDSILAEKGYDIMQNFQEMQRLKLNDQVKNDESMEKDTSAYTNIPTNTNTSKVIDEIPVPVQNDMSSAPHIKIKMAVPLNEILDEEIHEEKLTESLDDTRKDSLSFPIRPEYTFLQHFVDVSSVDRNFTVQEKFNRYYFSVTFQSEQIFYKPFPIYSNSPLIPPTNSSSSLSNALVPNPNYLPNNDLGTLQGWYEMNSTTSSKGLNIPDRVSNVTQLSIDSVLLFFSSMDAQCADISDHCFGKTLLHYPYLLLQIEELVSVYKSTNSFYAHNVIKIVRDKTWSQATCGDGFHLFRPVGNEMFTFPTPKASLNRLTIRILNPMGNELCVPQETLLVQKIRVKKIADPVNSAIQVSVIEVTTSNFFAVCQFYADHIVRFQDLTFYGSTSLAPFVNWLQDSNGHSIFYTPFTSSDPTVPISNKFYIKYPFTIKWSDGTMTPMKFGTETYSSLETRPLSPLNASPLINGSVYNTTIQTHVGFNVISRNMKNSNMSDNIRI